ncbi:hypothetical protein JXM67_01980 [candidate division WOR-3 bacterium]|nr:hypothetical protein [candidate division WOR-3 bacterium]
MEYERKEYGSVDSYQRGFYLITLRVSKREFLLGGVVDGKTALNELGDVVDNYWRELPKRYSAVKLDEYVIMPNHLHGIINLGRVAEPILEPTNGPAPDNEVPYNAFITQMISWFKEMTAKGINELRNEVKPLWEAGYWEHKIRTNIALRLIRNHLRRNPSRWYWDKENPTREGMMAFDRFVKEAFEDKHEEHRVVTGEYSRYVRGYVNEKKEKEDLEYDPWQYG